VILEDTETKKWVYITQITDEPFSETDIVWASEREEDRAVLIKHWQQADYTWFYVWKVLKEK
jgi:hypothetical protein